MAEDDEGKIVAASITYPHRITGPDGVERTKWQEVGSTRITLNGYAGLFDTLVSMQVVRAFLVEPPEDRFVAQMHTVPVQKMAAKLGWRVFEAKDELIDLKFGTLDPCDLQLASRENWYAGGVEMLPVMAAKMKDVLGKPFLEHAKTGEKIELDFSKSNFFTMFGECIRALADEDYGNPDTPDPKLGVSKRRKDWMRSYFK
jgi:hypothetical protein